MNSWKSNVLFEWQPPLIIFIIGVGIVFCIPPIYLYKGVLRKVEAALAHASDTARIEFAPSLFLFLVPILVQLGAQMGAKIDEKIS